MIQTAKQPFISLFCWVIALTLGSPSFCLEEGGAQVLVTLPQQHWVPQPYKEAMVDGACWWADK